MSRCRCSLRRSILRRFIYKAGSWPVELAFYHQPFLLLPISLDLDILISSFQTSQS